MLIAESIIIYRYIDIFFLTSEVKQTILYPKDKGMMDFFHQNIRVNCF